MHNIFIPISVKENQNRELTVTRLQDMGAKRVYLAVGRLAFYECDHLYRYLEIVKDAKEYYENAGFEVAFWITTFGFGGGEAHFNREYAKDFTPIRSISGKDADGAFCPTNKKFLNAICFNIRELAKLGPRTIMLDDEMCLSVRPGIGCCCDNHLKMLSSKLCEEMSLDDIKNKVFCKKPNKYRRAWFKVMGSTMREFCKAVREAVDSVDDSIRVGFCAGYTSWDFEGADAATLTKVLAGKTKPFLRYTGAPYWVEANRFKRITQASIIESVRMQRPWTEGIDTFIEGDSFPRERFTTSSAQCEIFDLALRGFLGFDALKYPFEYSMQPDYDSGYFNAHIKNAPMFEALKNTSGEEFGIRVYEYMSKIENAELPDTFIGEKELMEGFYFPHASKLLTSIGLPTVYEGKGVCGICFGENARYLEKENLESGMILDLQAAKILTERGIDVGLKASKPIDRAVCEWYGTGKSTVNLYPSGPVYDLEICESAKPMGYFKSTDILEDYSFPSCYFYKNGDGQKFFVYAWNGIEQRNDSVLYHSYYRSIQLQKALLFLTDDFLPVTAKTHPHLYTLCKKDKNTVYNVFFNIHPDEIENLRLSTGALIKKVTAFGANVTKTSPFEAVVDRIAPYGCVLVIVEL